MHLYIYVAADGGRKIENYIAAKQSWLLFFSKFFLYEQEKILT